MILNLNFDDLKKRDFVEVKCDYCYKNTSKRKADVLRGRKIIEKDSCSNRICISKKTKESNLKKYGVCNPTQNKEIKEKQLRTLVERYGVTSPSQNAEIKQKIADTNIIKYGNKCSLHDKKVKEKSIKTWEKKYGYSHPFSSPEIRTKIKESMQEKYGDHYTRTSDYLEKTKKTCIEKYGKEHSSQSPTTQEKRKKTNLEKYGCEFVSQNVDIKNKIFALGNQRKNYGKTQNEIKEYISKISGIEFSSIMLEGKELDIYNDKLKLAIEYCGLWWHNEKSPDPRNRTYHWYKYNKCLENNIRLITIFEDEWVLHKNKCKNYLSSILGIYNDRIFARKCKLVEVDNVFSNKFYCDYHLFGKPYNTKKSFALCYKENVLAVMSLGSHHRSSSETVINRLCFKEGFQIIGGVSRLFSACTKWCRENKIEKITTWSDNRWSTGSTYEKIGFKLDKSLAPDYSYVDLKKKLRRTSKQSQKIKKNPLAEYKTELEGANANNLARIWDCGKKRWIFEIKELN